MVVDEAVQTEIEQERKAFQEKVVKEGRELWKRQKEFAKMKKLREQQEMREMLDQYWPWGRASDAKPRGLRNLRLEDIFPNEDYENAKRYVGTAPLVHSGKKMTRTHEDPFLRFQFGSKDLRKWVDNTLRYKTDRQSQQEYKKQLDKLVEEKKSNEKKEKLETRLFYQHQGWSDEDTLKKLDHEELSNKHQEYESDEKFRKNRWLPNKVRFEPITSSRRNFVPVGKNRRLSPLSNSKENGVELVTLLSKTRKYPLRIPLCSSDVTRDAKLGQSSLWSRQGSAYLKEMAQQILYKQQKLKETKVEEKEFVQRHILTSDGYWGKPGHGAPLPEIKRQCLDRLLYPQMIPIGVH